jgi:zinc transport system substrate-binding protein
MLSKKKIHTKIISLFLIISILGFLPALLSGCSNRPGLPAETNNAKETDANPDRISFSTADTKKPDLDLDPKQESDLKIVSSFYPIYITLINITKDIDGISVTNMTEPQTGCLHDYTLTIGDMKKLEDADIFVINGAGMEGFLEDITSEMTGFNVIDASEGLELLEGHHEGDANPHIWVSISGCIEQTKNIANRLAELDKENSEKYLNNMNEYVEKLEVLKKQMHDELRDLPNRKIVTFHEAFPYFAKEFDLDIKAVMSEESGHGAETGKLKEVIDIVKKNKIKALFTEPQYHSETAQIISRETGAQIYTLDPIVTGNANGDRDAYIKKMTANMLVLKEALAN